MNKLALYSTQVTDLRQRGAEIKKMEIRTVSSIPNGK
jgi:hypothetical protein